MIRVLSELAQKARGRVVSSLNRSVDPSVAQVRAVALSLIMLLSVLAGVGGIASGSHATDWSNSLGESVADVETRTAAPHVYVGTGTSLYALDKSTGTVEWSQDVNATTVSWGGGYVFAEVDGTLHRFDDSDGGGMTSMGVDVHGGSLYANPQDDMVFVQRGSDEFLVGLEYDGTEIFSTGAGGIERGVGYDRESGYALQGQADGDIVNLYDGDGNQVASIDLNLNPNSPTNVISRGYRYVGSHDNFGDAAAVIDVPNETRAWSPGGTPSFEDGGPASYDTYVRSGDNVTAYGSTGSVEYDHNVTDGSDPVSSVSVAIADGNEVMFVSYGDTVERHTREDVDAPGEGTPDGTPEEPAVELDVNRYMSHGSTQDYQVLYTDESGDRSDVTSSATVTSNNTSVVTVDQTAHELIATSDTSINGTSEITAEISGESVTKTVTVANATLDNAKILPGTWRATAMISDDTIFFLIIVAMIMGVIGRYATAFAGLGMGQLAVAIGWWGGYVPEGVAMVSVFLVLFIGFNVAVNVDYTVQR